jgi:hypothetical protein
MQRAHARAAYTGFPAPPPLGLAGHHQHGAPGHGFCGGCGHPRSDCCCGCRQCMKEAKELLVEPTTTSTNLKNTPDLANAVARMSMFTSFANTVESSDTAAGAEAAPAPILTAVGLRAGKVGLGTAFIGGGCCVHLSVEYTPTGTADGIVGVLVQDPDTELAWIKKVHAGLGYQIKEGVVTTKPGAHLTALAVGATLRVRWCEVFSC